MLTFGQKQTHRDTAGAERRRTQREIAGMSEAQLARLMAKVVADSVVKRGSVAKEDFILAGVPAIEVTDERVQAAIKRARSLEHGLDGMREATAA